MIYFDNAATTAYKPLCVKLSTFKSLFTLSGNAGRSGHKLSIKCAEKVYSSRTKVSQFFGCPSAERVIFTSNCSEALNLAILGSAKQDGHVITTIFEHNSVLRPLTYLKKAKNVDFSLVSPNLNNQMCKCDFEKEIKPNTYAIIVNHISNVTGYKQNLDEIGLLCKKHNLLFIVDSAQSAGHEKINMRKQHISLLAFAGHKGLHGIQGIGGLCVNEDVKLTPIKFGGTGTQSQDLVQPTSFPEGFEVGTLNLPAIVALDSAITFTEKHFDAFHDKITMLSSYLLNALKENNITVIGENKNSAVVSIIVEGIESSYLSSILDEQYDIATRSGYHCAPLVHKFYKTEDGTVRISLDYTNTKHQIDKLIFALNKIKKGL